MKWNGELVKYSEHPVFGNVRIVKQADHNKKKTKMRTRYDIVTTRAFGTNGRTSRTSGKMRGTNHGIAAWKQGVSGRVSIVTGTHNAASRTNRAVTGTFHGAFLRRCAASGTNRKVFLPNSAAPDTKGRAPPRFRGVSGTNVRASPPKGKIASERKIL